MCRARWILAAVCLVVLIVPSAPAVADWDEGDDYKMHFPQLPDPNGWDVSASAYNTVADDWQCSETGYVSDIHIWGSWYGDNPEPPVSITSFRLEIWSDQPADPGAGIDFSRPLAPLWIHEFQAGDFIERIYGDPSSQGFFDPIGNVVEPNNHMITWQYNFFIPPEEALIQEEGTIYWLVVHVDLDNTSPIWGWKTTLNHWNDDSVYLDDGGFWQELFDPMEPGLSLDQAFVITGEPLADWGDAPDPTYPTLAASNGAFHTIGALMMGSSIDPEVDGQPDATATGDDNDGNDDEDGVAFNGPLVQGGQTTITVTVNAACALSAWIDFNGDGDWLDQYETIYSGVALNAGANTLPLGIPAGAAVGTTFARFRVTSSGFLPATGGAPDGEVEDYQVAIDELLVDWGDAPDPTYPTVAASNGAHHVIGTLMMGNSIDPESNGQPNATATGDDNDGNNDDDGVVFTTQLIPGQQGQLTVSVNAPCALSAWIDFNGDGDWLDQYETLFSGIPLNAGVNTLPLGIPITAASGTTFARFRVTSTGFLAPTGGAPDGEVEDYMVTIQEAPPMDLGDAPDAPFPTLLASSGAYHVLDGVTFLGATADAEPDGQPDGTATGDDNDGNNDDDGVVFTSPLIPGFTAFIDVTASGPGTLDAWIDFNANGSWADPGEQIFLSVPLGPGMNHLAFPVPQGIASAGVFSRFRFSSMGGLNFTGGAPEGEVEDYEVFIEDPLEDWGDAPDPTYPTLSASGGAVHTLVETVFLGAGVPDAETDGQPDATAHGDDGDGYDDEDGVVHSPGTIIPGGTTNVSVTASTTGYLNGWVDFNADGDWTDSGEQVFNDVSLSAGVNNLSFTSPSSAVTPTFARYRFDTTGGLMDIGPAADGEVEDYYLPTPLFIDGFESGDTTQWSNTVGLAP